MLPALFLAVALIFYRRNVDYKIYHYIYALMTFMVIGSFLVWAAIPLITLIATPPAGDDVTKFLEVSGLNPLLVSFIALLIMVLLSLTAYKIGLFSKVKENLLASSHSSLHERHSKFNKRQAALFVSILLGLAAFISYLQIPSSKVFENSFSMNVHDDLQEVKMAFTVNENKTYNMNLKLDAEGMLTDIRIYDEKENLVYQNVAEWFSLSTSLNLKAGNYLFLLTFIRDPEVMIKYFEEQGYKFSEEQITGLQELLKKNLDDEFTQVSFSAVIQ